MHLDAYLDRLDCASARTADLPTLVRLHRRHVLTIPFENLSPLLGDPVSLDVPALIEKLVLSSRGGYCFEHNSLFGFALEQIGFDIRYLAARVVWNRRHGVVNPRTHMAILTTLGGRHYLCDTGFGAVTLTEPLVLEPGVEQTTSHDRFRILAQADLFSLEVRQDGEWRAMYEFDLQPQLPVDYEAMNHFVQTHRDSSFTKVLMVCRPDRTGRRTLRDAELRRYEGGHRVATQTARSGRELGHMLRSVFGLRLPESPRLARVLDNIATSNAE